jgi:hypothetical protein
VRNVNVPIVQADEVYSYVQCQPQRAIEFDPERGEFWTFLSIAKNEKLIINYHVSKRTGEDTAAFLADLRSRMAGHFQFTTDGFRGYCAVNGSSGNVCRFKRLPNISAALSRRRSTNSISCMILGMSVLSPFPSSKD